MAFKAGTTTAFYLANAANALQNLSAYADSLSVPQGRVQLDVTAFGNDAEAFIVGVKKSGQISMSGPMDVTVYTQLTTAQDAGSLLGFIYGPAGSVATQPRVAGSVYVVDTSFDSSAKDRVNYSATLQISGALSNGTF